MAMPDFILIFAALIVHLGTLLIFGERFSKADREGLAVR